MIAATITPLVRAEHWAVRVFDFPRLGDLAARVDRIRSRSLDGLLDALGVSEEEAQAMVNGGRRASEAAAPSPRA